MELCAHFSAPEPSRHFSTPGYPLNDLHSPPFLLSSSQVLSSQRSFCVVVGRDMRFRTLSVTLLSWLSCLFITAVLLVSSAAVGPRFYA